MKLKTTLITLIGSAISANAALLNVVGVDVPLGDGSGITYTMAGAVAVNPQDNGGVDDLRFTSNAGGSFTITFSDAVDLAIFNTAVSQGVNFDGINPSIGYNAQVVADAGAWSYTGGDLDLTNGNNGGADVVGGLGTNTFTIGNARIFSDNNGDNVANSGAPFSQSDWGTFTISGTSSITYTFSDETNFDGIRIDAVAVPEPSSAALLGLCGFGLLARRRR